MDNKTFSVKWRKDFGKLFPKISYKNIKTKQGYYGYGYFLEKPKPNTPIYEEGSVSFLEDMGYLGPDIYIGSIIEIFNISYKIIDIDIEYDMVLLEFIKDKHEYIDPDHVE